MKEKSNRRKFIKNIGAIGAGAAAGPTLFIRDAKSGNFQNRNFYNPDNKSTVRRNYNDVYREEYLNRVAFPIGGIGTGMFCMEGTGAISHMSIHHRPALFNEPTIFGAISVKGIDNGTKVLEGPVPDWKKFGVPLAGNGRGDNTYGLPRFNRIEFKTEFPFGHITLEDSDIPVKVNITGWNPFIPTDPDNSSLPVGALEYTFRNESGSIQEAVFSYNAKNFIAVEKGLNSIGSMKNGFILSERGTDENPYSRADFAIFTDQSNAVVDHCWFRGGWFDPLTILWENISTGKIKAVDPVEKDAPGASVYVPLILGAGEAKTVRVFLVWYVPESDIRHGNDEDIVPDDNCDPSAGCCDSPSDIGLGQYDGDFSGTNYKPWYSSRFKDVKEVASYFLNHYKMLRDNSQKFSKAFYSSTLPPEVMEAVAANLTILKSTTVMRQYDGRLWNYEGSGDTWGCCHGSCTHVWNYAQAIPHLFPSLERSLRNTEFCEDQNSKGHQKFRASLPIRPTDHKFYSAADGQLGGIMKIYREWRISGEDEWLKKIFPMVKVSMDYCIRTWDPKNKGVIEEPHHNTYDIEFWGPDGMCTSFYLGALLAIRKMGDYLGENTSDYKKLYEKGKKYMETELFNGEYFFQEVKTEGLNAPNPAEASKRSFGGQYSSEALNLLKKEGPKYQYGKGCLSDGVLGAWIAEMCGLDEPVDMEKLISHLKAVYKYNLKKNLSDHVNPQRPSYALGDEGGLLLCSWPKGSKPALPFVYSNEVWTGIEYQVASHLMIMGMVNEGLDIVRTCRDRYDGRIRNPFNEYECGNWYARALASYGLIQGLTGIRYDAVEKNLYIDSKIGDFTCFISTDSGFGTVKLQGEKAKLNMTYGNLDVKKVYISGKEGSLES